MGDRAPLPLDRTIGSAIRERRLAAGLSQLQLGQAIGVAYQQVQKYETGRNRVAGARLALVAAALGCTLAELLSNDRDEELTAAAFLATAEGLRVANAFASISEGKDRAALIRIIEAVAAGTKSCGL